MDSNNVSVLGVFLNYINIFFMSIVSSSDILTCAKFTPMANKCTPLKVTQNAVELQKFHNVTGNLKY